MLFSSPRWDEVVYWALDLETSGLDPRRHRILSVGMVPVRRGAIGWGERFYSLVHPGSFEGLDDAAIAVHRILPEELRRAPPLAAVARRVEERLDGAVLLVHHAPLDVPFLRRAWRALGRPWPRRRQVVDTQALVGRLEHRLATIRAHQERLPRGLAEARADLGLPAYDYHHALTDALATAELFLALRARLRAARLSRLTL